MSMDLRPYQQEGANFLSGGASKARILGDEPGLGKTRQAIRAADTLKAHRVLVLCPQVAKSHWQREFQDLQTLPRHVRVLSKQHDAVDPTGHLKRPHNAPLVLIANYDLVQQRDQPLRNKLLQEWNLLILDEAHILKNPDAKKVKYIYGKHLDGQEPSLVSWCHNVFVLSGTIMPNHAGELWTHFHALAPHLIPDPLRQGKPLSYLHYLDRYATIQATPWGNKITGSRNLHDLKHKLAPFMLRRRKKDVLKDLPPLDFELYPLTLNDPPLAIVDPTFDQLNQLDDTELEALLSQTAALSTVRRVLGEAKAAPAVKLALTELEADPKAKIILFAHHLSVLDLMARDFHDNRFNVARIDGRTSPKDRDQAIQDFQHDPKTRVFLGQIVAAGTAITLTASSNVLIVEPSFVPAQNVQAASRAHRFGQKDSVLARYLYVPDTLDERIIKILHRKTRDIAIVTSDDTLNLGMPA